MSSKRFLAATALAFTIIFSSTHAPARAQVTPGEIITPDNASQVVNLVSPGNFILVRQGMTMKIVPTAHLDWPPPYKEATERYSPQVSLGADGSLKNYVAGLPFPLVDATDPDAATKIMWNFAFRPLATDDLDQRGVEAVSRRAGSSDEVEHFTFGHIGYYNSVGRTEVPPTPTDPDVLKTGIVSRSGAYPILEPAEMRGAGIIRQSYAIPGFEDAVWEYSLEARRLRRLPAAELADAFGVSRVSSSGPQGGVEAPPRPMPPLGIPIPPLVFPHESRTSPTGCWASARCSHPSRRRILPPRPVPVTVAVRYVRRIGRCATFT